MDELRAAGAGVVSLVAEEAGQVVGHVLFSPVRVERADGQGREALGLAPMAVRPEHQRRGIGGRLVEAGLAACRRSGHGLVFVLGHPEYYPRFGFVPAFEHGCRFRSEEFDPAFFVAELSPGALAGVKGLVHYHDAFDRFD